MSTTVRFDKFGWPAPRIKVDCARSAPVSWCATCTSVSPEEVLMCFVPVPDSDETYRHIHKKFIVTIDYDKTKLDQLAKTLGIRTSKFKNFKGGKILIVNDEEGE
jgi:hypothetical protein